MHIVNTGSFGRPKEQMSVISELIDAFQKYRDDSKVQPRLTTLRTLMRASVMTATLLCPSLPLNDRCTTWIKTFQTLWNFHLISAKQSLQLLKGL